MTRSSRLRGYLVRWTGFWLQPVFRRGVPPPIGAASIWFYWYQGGHAGAPIHTGHAGGAIHPRLAGRRTL